MLSFCFHAYECSSPLLLLKPSSDQRTASLTLPRPPSELQVPSCCQAAGTSPKSMRTGGVDVCKIYIFVGRGIMWYLHLMSEEGFGRREWLSCGSLLNGGMIFGTMGLQTRNQRKFARFSFGVANSCRLQSNHKMGFLVTQHGKSHVPFWNSIRKQWLCRNCRNASFKKATIHVRSSPARFGDTTQS